MTVPRFYAKRASFRIEIVVRSDGAWADIYNVSRDNTLMSHSRMRLPDDTTTPEALAHIAAQLRMDEHRREAYDPK